MRFIVNVWNHGMGDAQFERTIPLLFNGRRLAKLGIPNKINVLFLKGLEHLSASYKDELRDLDYQLHDVAQLSNEESAALPLFVDKYANWGGIRHHGLTRFLVIPRYFGQEDVITFDGDMVLNASFTDMEHAFQNSLYFLDGSSCFGSIPASSGFFETFRDSLVEFQKSPEAFARDVFSMTVEDYFDPHISQGTDQAFILKLMESGRITLDNGQKRLTDAGLIGFANWLFLDRKKAPYAYERRDNIDYLNGMKVLISHMSHDTCAYFGQFIHLWRMSGSDGFATSGRMPLPYAHYADDEADPNVKRFYDSIRNIYGQHGRWLETSGGNPFKRDAVLKALYEESDFSLVLREKNWHAAGFFNQ